MEEDFDALKVDEKTARGFTGDLDAGSAFGAGHTAAFELSSRNGTSMAYGAEFRHRIFLKNLKYG